MALSHQVVRLTEVIAIRTLLAAGLKHSAITPRRSNHRLSLLDGQRERLFAVNVLAGFHGRNCNQGMPMVGRGNHDRINGLVVQQIAKVLVNGYHLARLRLDGLGGFLTMELVDIADGDHVDAQDSGATDGRDAAVVQNRPPR